MLASVQPRGTHRAAGRSAGSRGGPPAGRRCGPGWHHFHAETLSSPGVMLCNAAAGDSDAGATATRGRHTPLESGQRESDVQDLSACERLGAAGAPRAACHWAGGLLTGRAPWHWVSRRRCRAPTASKCISVSVSKQTVGTWCDRANGVPHRHTQTRANSSGSRGRAGEKEEGWVASIFIGPF